MFRDDLVQQLGYMRAVGDVPVQLEKQLRGVAQLQRSTYMASQIASGRFQSLNNICTLLFVEQ